MYLLSVLWGPGANGAPCLPVRRLETEGWMNLKSVLPGGNGQLAWCWSSGILPEYGLSGAFGHAGPCNTIPAACQWVPLGPKRGAEQCKW